MRILGLPFPFEVHGDVHAGGPASFHVELNAPVEDVRFDQLRCVVGWFGTLAELGAFCGAALAPGYSRGLLPTGEPDARSYSPTWQFTALAVDPGAVVVLANLVHATGLSVRRAALVAGGATDPRDLGIDAFPLRSPALPFSVDEDLVDRNVSVSVQFVGDVPDSAHDVLLDGVRTWSMVAALGGFREPGPLREEMDLIPEDEPEIVLDELRFSLRDNGVNPAAYDTLLALFAGYARNVMAIATVTLE